MAKPDCDDGWYKKSIELEAALDFADFTMLARTVLRYAFCQMFGPGARPRHAILNCAEIAARIRRPRQHVSRGLAELVASGALVPLRAPKDAYRFVKDYERWVMVARLKGSFYPTDRRRLTPEEVADSMDAPTYSRSFQNRHETDVAVVDLEGKAVLTRHRDHATDDDASGINIDADPHSDRHSSGINIDAKPGTHQSPSGINRDASRINLDADSASIEMPIRINIDAESAPPYVPPSRKESETKREPEDDDPACVPARGPGSKPETADELIAWLPCIGVGGDDAARLARKIPAWVERIRARFPQHAPAAIDWVQDALIAGCDKDDVVAYAEGTLKGYAQAGGRKDVELAPKPDPELQALPAPPAPPRASGYSPRQNKGQRNAEIAAARKASMARLFPPSKEANDGSR